MLVNAAYAAALAVRALNDLGNAPTARTLLGPETSDLIVRLRQSGRLPLDLAYRIETLIVSCRGDVFPRTVGRETAEALRVAFQAVALARHLDVMCGAIRGGPHATL